MAYSSTDMTRFNFGITDFYFDPTELVYLGMTETTANQVQQESESGELKILQLDTNIRRTATWSINKMRWSTTNVTDPVMGAIQISGASALRTMLTSATYCEYRINTVSLWLPGTIKSGSADGTYRFTDASFVLPVVRKPDARSSTSSEWRYGDGSQMISFRQEI